MEVALEINSNCVFPRKLHQLRAVKILRMKVRLKGKTAGTRTMTEQILLTHTTPNQPNPQVIAPQKLPKKTLHFQDKWYKLHPWLHYNECVTGILCFYCVKTYTIEKSSLSKRAELAYSLNGFTNWKHATARFKNHELSQSHQHAVTAHAQKGKEVSVLLSSAVDKQQQEARHCLEKIVASVVYLARQGLALRGHELKDGNLFQLLKCKAKDDATLSRWLLQSQDYTFHRYKMRFCSC